MDIDFKTAEMGELMNDFKKLVRSFNVHRAKRIRQRLDELKAAPKLADMRTLPGRCHELKGTKNHTLSLDLDGPYRLILKPSNDPIPLNHDGGLDWNAVTAITVQEVRDTHD